MPLNKETKPIYEIKKTNELNKNEYEKITHISTLF